MKHWDGTFTGAGDLSLYYQVWQPEQDVRAVLAIVHGLGGHSDLFDHVVQVLVPQHYAIYSFDLRGHGRSGGQRGYINRWAEFRDDLRRFLHLIERQTNGRPRFLLGHSLGAIIVLDYALRFPEGLQGIVATAIPMGTVGVSPLKLVLGQILSQIWPTFSLNTGIDRSMGSRDPEVVAASIQDPLRHTWGTARLATEFQATASWIRTHASELSLPFLSLHGDADRVALPQGSRSFFERLTVPDKEHREYAGGYHDLYNDINHQEVTAHLRDWLAQHLVASRQPENSWV